MSTSAEEQSRRREMLRELLLAGPAGNQQMLVHALDAKGFSATQSSVSRDLRVIGAIKTNNGYELAEADNGTDEVAHIAEFLRDIATAGPNLTIIRTAIGAAQRVALALDRSNWPEMIGNIGGDDTVFVATTSAATQKNLIARIERSRSA